MYNSVTILTDHDLNRNFCNPEAKTAALHFQTLLYANYLPFPCLPNWNRSREEFILYWSVCYPDVSHDLKVYTFPP